MTAQAHGEAPMPPWRGDIADVAVIGAGLVGLATAYRLARQGKRVVVVEREGIAAGASRGNAGAFAFSDIHPLASPRILRQLPRWLSDPLGPLTLRPAYLPRILPWLIQFARACEPARVAASTAAQAALNGLSARATHALLDSLGARELWREDGNLHLYASHAHWQRSLRGWEERAAHGIGFTHLHGHTAISECQPGLAERFTVATLVPGWATIRDPLTLCERLAAACAASGAQWRHGEAVALQSRASDVTVTFAEGAPLGARQVVVAAGPWSHTLAASLGDRLPLEVERGYNTTFAQSNDGLRRQLTFVDDGFVMTRIGHGVRVGGAVELAGRQAPPNYKRADAMLAKARAFAPGVQMQDGKQWMGMRPSFPDSLPVIGLAKRDVRVAYAFGHGHLGLTQCAATAELVAALLAGEKPAIDLTPFRPERFG
jgi:D-amino-acid dehydrogenase